MTDDLAGRKALVVGGSRGFGRGIADALLEAGAEVFAVAREVAGGRAHAIRADATEPGIAARLLGELRPSIVVLSAGAIPHAAPLREQTWESFSTCWDADVRMTFAWTRALLEAPLAPGSTVVTLSSGAALRGSPLSGGYAGAKAMVRFMTEYAAQESARAGAEVRFATLLPTISTEGEVGRRFVDAYARRQNKTAAQFLGGPALTAAAVGAAVLRIVRDRSLDAQVAFTLNTAGLAPLAGPA